MPRVGRALADSLDEVSPQGFREMLDLAGGRPLRWYSDQPGETLS
jgi:hypothetical protein